MMPIQLPGEFRIDGVSSYEGLFPEISVRFGLDLHRRKIGSNGEVVIEPDGPHFCFPFFCPFLLTTTHLLEELKANPTYTFQGPNIGSISKSGGYLHGYSNIRRVTMVSLSLTFSKVEIVVEIKGSTGPVIPGNGQSDKASLEFDLWFTLPVSSILAIAPECGERGVKSLTDLLSRI